MHPDMKTTLDALRTNNFTAHHAATPDQARDLILGGIIPQTSPGVVSYGDSLTLFSLGVLEAVKADPALELIDTFETGVDEVELDRRRRAALTADLFMLGTNAVTMDGRLVNLDMVGNRIAGLVYGPRHVVVVVGRNKIAADLEAAMTRVKEHCAPTNAARHHCRTPCARTGTCADCNSPGRICNVWSITAKSYPRGRIHVVLMDGDHGI